MSERVMVEWHASGHPYIHPTWWGAQTKKDAVYMTCPQGHTGSLAKHTIKLNGEVEPSVQCPEEGCEFHAYVTLQHWEVPLDAGGRDTNA